MDAIYVDPAGNTVATGWLETLIDLIFQRLELAEDVAAEKFASGRPVDDPGREQEILNSVARVLHGSGPYEVAVMQFFLDQIAANKLIQRGLHQRWHSNPEEVPAVHRDLTGQIRPRLDRITARMLWHLVVMNELPNLGSEYVQALVDKKLAAEPIAREFRGLGRDAAVVALRSFMADGQRGPAPGP